MSQPRDHGGGLDAAVVRWGGRRAEWIDLSTGINPVPYPVGDIPPEAWAGLPDQGAMDRLVAAARGFWRVPDGAGLIAANGASALIAAMPRLCGASVGSVNIPGPTYNEHQAAFEQAGWTVLDGRSEGASAQVLVHPNNPDGRLAVPDVSGRVAWTVIDESFCDVCPQASLVGRTAEPGWVVLKSFGKFWGLAGLRLGFLIGAPEHLERMAGVLGPWAVSGPALEIGAQALADHAWAAVTRVRLAQDASRLDRLMAPHGALIGGTDLFRLYDVGDAVAFQAHLAEARIWSRVFPYSEGWVRLGLPAPEGWARLEAAL